MTSRAAGETACPATIQARAKRAAARPVRERSRPRKIPDEEKEKGRTTGPAFSHTRWLLRTEAQQQREEITVVPVPG